MGTLIKIETRGRKPLPTAERKTEKLNVRFSAVQIKELRKQAKKKKVSFSAFIHGQLGF